MASGAVLLVAGIVISAIWGCFLRWLFPPGEYNSGKDDYRCGKVSECKN